MKCKQCGEETFLPFQCPYCGGQFCSLHRLPENHACAKMEVARSARQDEVLVSSSPKSYQYSVTVGQSHTVKGRVYFSPREVKHLLVAGLLVMGIGLSSVIYAGYADWVFGLSVYGIFAVILTGSFFAHEIAHKVMAQKRGLWAEFRLTLWGAVVTLISVISPFFKFISPGAVMVSGSASTKEMGKVSLAGPAVNCFLSVVFFGLALVPSQFSGILFFAAFLNGFMAVFNLIPVGILDGYKIFSWDKKVWAVIFAASVALTGVAYAIVSGWVTF